MDGMDGKIKMKSNTRKKLKNKKKLKKNFKQHTRTHC